MTNETMTNSPSRGLNTQYNGKRRIHIPVRAEKYLTPIIQFILLGENYVFKKIKLNLAYFFNSTNKIQIFIYYKTENKMLFVKIEEN